MKNVPVFLWNMKCLFYFLWIYFQKCNLAPPPPTFTCLHAVSFKVTLDPACSLKNSLAKFLDKMGLDVVSWSFNALNFEHQLQSVLFRAAIYDKLNIQALMDYKTQNNSMVIANAPKQIFVINYYKKLSKMYIFLNILCVVSIACHSPCTLFKHW